MITYDWQQRLKKDTLDFLEHKVPEHDFDFEIIYNIYPERVNGEVPQPVITFVAKEMRKVIQNDPDPYINFLLYIHIEKGENGKKIFNYVMNKVTIKHPGAYDKILKKAITELNEKSDIKKFFDSIILPLLKKYPEKYLDEIISIIRSESNEDIIDYSFSILCKYMKSNKKKVKETYRKIESFWSSDKESVRMGIVQILKCIFKLDNRFYHDIYKEYQTTYNPNFIEILSEGICEDSSLMHEIIERWEKSGNVRIKKAAHSAQKTLKKLKRK